MTLQLSNASKSYGADEIFTQLNFEIKAYDKIAIIGRNGCGKTTLLKILADQLSLDKGDIFKPRDLKVGYLAQANATSEELTIEAYFEPLFREIFALETELGVLASKLNERSSEEDLQNYATKMELF